MEAIADAGIEPIVETVRLECRVAFESTGDLHQLAERYRAAKLEEHWDGNGPRLTVEIEREAVDGFVEELAGITGGEGVVERLG